MNLIAVGSAFPSNRFTQLECLDAMKGADFWQGLTGRSRMVLEKVLVGESGIQKRHFALDSLEEAWRRGAQELNEAYEQEAPDLAAEVCDRLRKAAVVIFARNTVKPRRSIQDIRLHGGAVRLF